jgi:CubicO group peptidase (beta-lactamase class C family)
MDTYFPEPDTWQHLAPADAGFNPQQFTEALTFAADCEIQIGKDLSVMLPSGARHPNDRPLGPLKERSSAAGLVLKNSHIVGTYGPVDNVQLTFSCTKSYLSATAGLAYDGSLIKGLDEPVRHTVLDGGFDSEQNALIHWRHLLHQTSEWEGELFGVPDWIDRGRVVGGPDSGAPGATVGGSASSANDYRALEAPGSYWEYNDVRVNRTSLSLLRLFHEPLPEILKTKIMDPIGASNTWQWHGYETSWVEENGRRIQSVSGGAHWGGGLWINTYDHARFGLLYLRRGRWQNQQLLSKTWIDQSLVACPINPEYGFLWWLNHNGAIADLASAKSFAAKGAGGNVVFVEPERDLVIVLRWCADPKRVLDRILASEMGA